MTVLKKCCARICSMSGSWPSAKSVWIITTTTRLALFNVRFSKSRWKSRARPDLPVEIHSPAICRSRDGAEVLARRFQVGCADSLHCFTSSWELAKKALDHGFHISISGVVTFKNAVELRDVVTRIPLDRLHVETDAPFLAPVPNRGKKNEPAWVTHTASVVAGLKGISLDELASHTRRNALDLFPRMKLNNLDRF